jgi:hypothetical protein
MKEGDGGRRFDGIDPVLAHPSPFRRPALTAHDKVPCHVLDSSEPNAGSNSAAAGDGGGLPCDRRARYECIGVRLE